MFYCPGGIDQLHIDKIYDYVYNSYTIQSIIESQTRLCTLCKCPLQTETYKKHATNINDCLHVAGVKRVSSSELYYCDDSKYNSSEITEFYNSEVDCERKCIAPGAIKNENGDCICNIEMGYNFNVITKSCDCMPGWYKKKDSKICYECPVASYCIDGNQMTVCPPQMTSKVRSTSSHECSCLMGSYKPTQTTQNDDIYCKKCPREKKCNGTTTEQCNRELNEICQFTGTSIPTTCDPGYTVEKSTQNNLAKIADCIFGGRDKESYLFTNILLPVDNNNWFRVFSPPITHLLSLVNALEFDDEIHLRVVCDFQPHVCTNEAIVISNTTKIVLTQGSENEPLFKCLSFTMTGHLFKKPTPLISISPVVHPPANSLGLRGFIDASSHIKSSELIDLKLHLSWNIIFSCRSDITSIEMTDNVFASEIKSCVGCVGEYGEYISLIKKTQYIANKRKTNSLYVTFDEPLPVTNQLFWTNNVITSTLYLKVTQYSPEMNLTDGTDVSYNSFIEFRIYSNESEFINHTQKLQLSAAGDIVFILQCPVWRPGSSKYPTIIIGACNYDMKNEIMLHFYDIGNEVLNTVRVSCLHCCNDHRFKKIAILDISTRKLTIAIGTSLTYVMLDENIQPMSSVFTHNSKTKTIDDLLPAQILSLQFGYCQNEYHVLLDSNNGEIGKIKNTSTDELKYEYIKYASADEVIVHLQRSGQNADQSTQDLHHTTASLFIDPSEIIIENMAIVSQRDPVKISQSTSCIYDESELDVELDVVVYFKCANVVGTLSHVLVFVRFDSIANIVETAILTSFFEEGTHMSGLWYSPTAVMLHKDAFNIVYVTGSINIIIQDFDMYTIQTFEIGCVGCNSNEIFDVETHQCKCVPGTMSVCMQCTSLLCETDKRLVSGLMHIPDSCIVGSDTTSPSTNSIYSVQCVPCWGNFFCPSGNNTEILKCPDAQPFAVKPFAKTYDDCSCAENTSYAHANVV